MEITSLQNIISLLWITLDVAVLQNLRYSQFVILNSCYLKTMFKWCYFDYNIMQGMLFMDVVFSSISVLIVCKKINMLRNCWVMHACHVCYLYFVHESLVSH